MTVNVVVVLLFGEQMGVGGIALTTAFATAVNMTVNLIAAYRCKLLSVNGSDYADAVKSVVSAVLMGGAVWLVYRQTAALGRLISFALPVLAGVIVYAVLTAVLRSEEMQAVLKKLRGTKS